MKYPRSKLRGIYAVNTKTGLAVLRVPVDKRGCLSALIADVLLNDVRISRFSDGIDVKAARPELPSPEELSPSRMTIEHFTGGDAFDGAGDLCW